MTLRPKNRDLILPALQNAKPTITRNGIGFEFETPKAF